MTPTRREFLAASALGALSAALPLDAQVAAPTPAKPANLETPGAPTAFGTSSPVGPPVSTETFAEAEKLVQVEMTAADRAQAAGNWREAMAPLYERRTGPRKVVLETGHGTGDGVESDAAGYFRRQPRAEGNHFVRSAGGSCSAAGEAMRTSRLRR